MCHVLSCRVEPEEKEVGDIEDEEQINDEEEDEAENIAHCEKKFSAVDKSLLSILQQMYLKHYFYKILEMCVAGETDEWTFSTSI